MNERNLNKVKALADRANSQFRFIGLSLSGEGLLQYVAKNDLKLPVYSVSTEVPLTYVFTGTPQTIVISRNGRVLQNWIGAYVGDQKVQVETFFHVILPSVRSQLDESN
jgi:hypothetical protein